MERLLAQSHLPTADLTPALLQHFLAYGTPEDPAAEARARSHGVQQLCLLTTTAERFFERLGYERADREAAPTAIRGTSEFTSLCPASAAFMRKRLGR